MIDLTNILKNIIYANKDFLIFLMMKNPLGGRLLETLTVSSGRATSLPAALFLVSHFTSIVKTYFPETIRKEGYKNLLAFVVSYLVEHV